MMQTRRAVLGAWLCLFSALASGAEAQVTVDFTADVTTGTNPVDVTFTSIITGTTSTNVLWNFGDGMTSTELNPMHTYTGPGAYSVTLAVFVGLNPIAELKTDYIVVDVASFTPDFTVDVTAGTNPVEVVFTDTTTGVTPTSWVWAFGDGNSAIEQNPSHIYDKPGVFNVTLVAVFGTQHASITKTKLITVEPALFFADFDVNARAGESPFPVDFSDTSTGAAATSWRWDFGDGKTSTVQHPTHTYVGAGVYTVTLTAWFGGQESEITKSQLIRVSPAQFEPDFVSDVTSGVNPLTVQFTDTTEVGVTGTDVPDSWRWRFTNPNGVTADTSSEQNPTMTFEIPGSYSVSLEVRFAGTEKTVTKADAIFVEPAPLLPDFTADVTDGTVPLTVQFENLTTGNPVDEWEWRFVRDGTFGPLFTSVEENPIVTFTTPGDYQVVLTATIGGQTAKVRKEAFIRVRRDRLVAGFSSDTVIGEVPVTIAFESETLGVEPTAWRWSFDHLDTIYGPKIKSEEQNPEVEFVVPGIYTVELLAWYEGQLEKHVEKLYLDLAPYASTEEVESVVASHGVSDNFEASEAFIVSGTDAWVVAYDTTNYLLQEVVGADTLNVNSIPAWSLDDTRLILGSPDSGALGLVSIADLTTGETLGQFGPSDGDTTTYFGLSVDLDGDRALVGAKGFAYLFDVSAPSTPVLLSKFSPQSDATTWWFSSAVLHGDRVLLGSLEDAAFLFDISDPTAPVELGAVFDDPGTQFAQDLQLALGDDVALVGSENAVVRVLDAQTGELRTELDHPFGLSDPEFGISLAVSNGYAIVGAAHEWQDHRAGAAFLYDVETLELAGRVAPSDGEHNDHFGWGMQVVGNTLYVGAPLHNEYQPNAGKLYRFELPHNAVWSDAGGGSPVDAPTLVGNGNFDPNSTASLSLTNAPPNAPLFLVIGQSELPVPFAGGVMMPAPDIRLGGYSTDAFGTMYLPTSVPAVIPPGTSLVIQAWMRDVEAVEGFAGSNAVRAEVLGVGR